MGQLSEEQHIRFAAALERVGNDDRLLVSLAQITAEDAPILMAQLECNIESGDLNSVAATGHALKGLLSTYETGSPVAELQLLIEAARSGDRTEVRKVLAYQRPILIEFIGEVQKLTARSTT